MTIYYINEFLNNHEPTPEEVENAKHHAKEGNPLAQYHLALMYDIGKGVNRNPKEAEKWYKLSANQGNIDAQYFLARLYSMQNSGIRRDEKEAEKWYKKAADGGRV